MHATTLGGRVRELRTSAGWSMQELADRVGVNKSSLSRLERGLLHPTPTLLGALARVFDLVPADLDPAGMQALTPRGWLTPVPINPDDRDRLVRAAERPSRADLRAIEALEAVLRGTRHLEDSVGASAVLPSVSRNLDIASKLVDQVPIGLRDRAAALVAEMHGYAGWLLAMIGRYADAVHNLDSAHVLATEVDDPAVAASALSYRGYVAWMMGDPSPVVSMSRAACRDPRVYIGQRAYNVHQEALGWAMMGDTKRTTEILAAGAELLDEVVEGRATAPASAYWYATPGFLTVQAGQVLVELSRHDPGVAARAAGVLIGGLGELPESDQVSEWAGEYVVQLAEVQARAGQVQDALASAVQAAGIADATSSVRLASGFRGLHARWSRERPGDAAVAKLAEVMVAARVDLSGDLAAHV